MNNASFGAYAEVVQSPAYRDDKRGTTLQMLPDILSGHRGAKLTARAGDATVTGPQALLVSNGPYGMTDIAGLGRRARLDAGMLGVVAVTVNSALQAATLLRGARGQGLTVLTAGEVVVDADVPEIPVGIDGETVMMPTPVPGHPNPNLTGRHCGSWHPSGPHRQARADPLARRVLRQCHSGNLSLAKTSERRRG